MNHLSYSLAFALNLPLTSFVCSCSSNPNSGLGRDHEQMLLAQPLDFVQPSHISSCASLFQPEASLVVPCLETTDYFTLLSLVKTGSGTPDRVPEAQKLCTKQLGLPHPDKSWKCLWSLPSIFSQCQPAAMVDTRLHCNWELGLFRF